MDTFNETNVWGDSSLKRSTDLPRDHIGGHTGELPGTLTEDLDGQITDTANANANANADSDSYADPNAADSNPFTDYNDHDQSNDTKMMEEVDFRADFDDGRGTESRMHDAGAEAEAESEAQSEGRADADDIDEFKIQNELAATMQSLAVKADTYDDASAQNDAVASVDAAATSRRLLSSLTESDPVHIDEIVLPGADETLFRGQNDQGGPLDVLAMTDDSSEPLKSPNTIKNDSSERSLVSPNKKKTLLRRPRRVKSGVDTRHTDEVNIDPLTALQKAKTISKDAVETAKFAVSSRTNLIASLNKPLFQLDRQTVVPKGEETANSSLKSPQGKPTQELPSYSFDITVGDPIKVGEITNAHVVYTISTESDSPMLRTPQIEVTRRYRDFLWLYHQLLNNHLGYIIPPPPEKQVYGRFDDRFIENRRIALERMLSKISERPVFQNDPDFILFLQSAEFSEESHDREHAIKHGRDDDSPLFDDNTGSGSSPGSFFSSLMGLNMPKFVETDNFILERQNYTENLSNQLGSLSKSLDFILEKREELIRTQGELVKLISSLADIEVNSEVTELMTNFEELQKKIEQLMERSNLSQIMTIGATIDEYIRVIGSIRNCFENRFKLCSCVVNLEYQQSKKQKQLERVRANNHNQTDKLEKYEKELQAFDATLAKQQRFRDEFTRVLKSELARFEFEKVKEFKNVIEIYWEGLIESQKELIELWESFYSEIESK
ncbi:hypothetical protein FOA43_001316 [Brettanomyces nanus]|uniref:PX domain-containing protein n=1 Tax=Eeniella nana TaxID=13502 RepID=A0A875S2E2_EENNA|nr:uncharacterized protein FOA43_001316 [Brettanomyces nanus]QPG73999.1 hypothetical protein FOA43_001316 [Brettanomyces nanus]